MQSGALRIKARSGVMRALLLLLMLAACTEPAAPPTPVEVARPYAFVGDWAVNADYCRQYAWEFREDHVATPGEVYCRWDEVERTAAGYRLSGTCMSEGTSNPDAATLTFDGPDTMTAQANIWSQPMRLVRCGA